MEIDRMQLNAHADNAEPGSTYIEPQVKTGEPNRREAGVPHVISFEEPCPSSLARPAPITR